MTHRNDSTTLDQLMELLIHDGPDAMAQALTTLLNSAMRIEREQALGAAAHQRTDTRRGYANGYKPKTLFRETSAINHHCNTIAQTHSDN